MTINEGTRARSILVAGASGDTGRRILEVLDSTEKEARAVTRSSLKGRELRELGADEVVVGDLLRPEDAERLVEGVDVVLSAVGSTIEQIRTEDEFVDGVGNKNLARAAEKEDVEHFVMESAIGVGDEPSGLFGKTTDLVIGPVQEAKAEAEREIKSSSMDYTILRPGALAPVSLTCSVQVAEAGSKLWGGVSLKNVARLMTASPYTPEAKNRVLEVVQNPLLKWKDIGVDWNHPE